MNAVQTQITVQMHQQEGAQTPWEVFFVRVTQDTEEMESHVLVGIQPTSFLILEKVFSGTFRVYLYLLRKNVHFCQASLTFVITVASSNSFNFLIRYQ